jgi:AAA15 family ATPase/GTPase
MEAKSPMCIDEFGCNNFKKFNSRIDLEFRPITILIGPNNSGKSTIIKGLNFLNILKSSPEKEEILKYTNKFSELLNRDSKEKSFYISVKFNLISDFKFGYKFSFRDITIDNFKTDYIGSFLQKGRNAQITNHNNKSSLISYNSINYSAILTFIVDCIELWKNTQIILEQNKDIDVFDKKNNFNLPKFFFEPDEDWQNIFRGYFDIKFLGCKKNEIHQSMIIFGNLERNKIKIIENILLDFFLEKNRDYCWDQFNVCFLEIFDLNKSEIFKHFEEQNKRNNINDENLMFEFELDKFFYRITNNIPNELQKFKEDVLFKLIDLNLRITKDCLINKTIDILLSMKSDYKNILPIEHINFTTIDRKSIYRKEEFKDNYGSIINSGLKQFKFNFEIDYEETRLGYKIFCKDEFGTFELNQNGTGFYKIFHLLYRLADSKDKILCFEEPESNLHPNFQAQLANIFMDTVNLADNFNSQYIIETHSEYFIRRFQVLIAKKELSPEKIIIHYFDPEGDVYPIIIDENGSLSRPFGEGFYDSSITEKAALFNLTKESKN